MDNIIRRSKGNLNQQNIQYKLYINWERVWDCRDFPNYDRGLGNFRQIHMIEKRSGILPSGVTLIITKCIHLVITVIQKAYSENGVDTQTEIIMDTKDFEDGIDL